MKRKIISLVCFMFIVSLTIVHSQTHIFVAPNGNDSNSGTISSPLKTLIGARDKVRSLKSSGIPAGGIVVNFRAGTYPVTSTCNMNSQDSGESGNPITYTAYNEEKVILDGNLLVNPSGFTSMNGSKIHNNAQGKVYAKTITDNTLINILKEESANMSMDGDMMAVARYPNIGLAHVLNSSIQSGYETVRATGTISNPKGAWFRSIENVDAPKWQAEINRIKKARAVGYLSETWWSESILITSFSSGGMMRLKDGSRYGVRNKGVNNPNRFYINHLLCELDQPGEWYFDDNDNILYIWPYTTINSNSKLGVWAGPELVNINGTRYVNFENFTIQNLGKDGQQAAIDIHNANNVTIAGCTFKNIALPLAPISIDANSTYCGAQSCNFYDNARGSRLYGGKSTSNSITHGRNYFRNCHFTQIYSRSFYGTAISIYGNGNYFTNNLVHNSKGQPIVHGGNDHEITLNEIFNVGIEEGDGGAIYTGADIWSHGNIIKHNFIHHLIKSVGLRCGLYSDDHDGGDNYIENVMFKAGYSSIYINDGAGHTVQDNIMMEHYYGVYYGSPSPEHLTKAREYLRNNPNSTAKENYLGRAEKVIGDFVNNSTGNYNTSFDNSFWANRYPYLKWALRNTTNPLAMFPIQNRCYENMFYVARKQNINLGVGSLPAEKDSRTLPGWHVFLNSDNLNFKWSSAKPSYAPNIPFDKIGLIKDKYRCAVPNKNTYRSAVRQRWANVKSHDTETYNPATINSKIYYNTGKLVTDLIPCENQGGSNGGGENYVSMRKRNAMDFAIDGNSGCQGTNVQMWSYSSSNENLKWEEINRGGDYYSYKLKNTNYCLDGQAGGYNDQNVHLWTCNAGNQNQHWKKINVGSGYYRLEKRVNPAYSIDGSSGGANGNNVKVWASNDSNYNQHWFFESLKSTLNDKSIVSLSSEFHIYPNPVEEKLSISINESISDKAMLYIYDNKGALIKQLKNKEMLKEIDLSLLADGLYILKLINGSTIHIDKFIKQ